MGKRMQTYTYVSKGKEKHKYYNPVVSSNTAISGAGVYNNGEIVSEKVTFSKSNANNNSSNLTSDELDKAGNGGAIYNNGKLTVSNSTFSSNNATTILLMLWKMS